MRTARCLAIVAIASLAACRTGAPGTATVESTAPVTTAAPAGRAVPGTGVRLVVPDGFAIDEIGQSLVCVTTIACGDTSMFVAWRTASSDAEPARVFADGVGRERGPGHAVQRLSVGGHDAVRIDADADTVNPGVVVREYRVLVGVRTVRLRIDSRDGQGDALRALSTSVEQATIGDELAPIDRGWTLTDSTLRPHESSPRYADLGPGERPSATEPSIAISYGCYAEPATTDDARRDVARATMVAQGVTVVSSASVTVDTVDAWEVRGTVMHGGTAWRSWSVMVFRPGHPLVVVAEHDPAAGDEPMALYQATLAALRFTAATDAHPCP